VRQRRQWRDVLEHPAGPWHRRDGLSAPWIRPRCGSISATSTPAGTDPIPQLIDALEEIVVTATLDVATLPTCHADERF